ncbi:MAG: hypothetical protein M3466_15985 [Gemmatimonadota bacterium]|nr:hypothetical protein [Gemmatimonadota bacterium]
MANDVERIEWPGYFALDVPKSWQWSEDGRVISIFSPEGGVGAMHVSVARHSRPGYPSTSEVVELAQSLASQRGWTLPADMIRVTKIGMCLASEFTYLEPAERIFWQVWYILGKDRCAFITYSCDEVDSNKEEAERTKLVESFRWQPSP